MVGVGSHGVCVEHLELPRGNGGMSFWLELRI
jgi:hypothetical protein